MRQPWHILSAVDRPVIAIVQARMGSTRLPGKVLAPARGRPLLAIMLDRVRGFAEIDAVVVATTALDRDDPVAALADDLGVEVFRGSEDDVLGRFVGAAEQAQAGTVIRLTADCPLIVPEAITAVTAALDEHRVDLATNAPPQGRTWPDGFDAEAFSRDALDRLDAIATTPEDREHVTRGFHVHPQFSVHEVHLPQDLGSLRLTIDTAEDLELVRRILELLGDGPSAMADVLEAAARVS
jgi:spore coat polysaccharide biosynthesis protein SpsF